jgi:Iron-containing redox enzyme
MESRSRFERAEIGLTTYLSKAENEFLRLLSADDLDAQLLDEPESANQFEQALTFALVAAYDNANASTAAHLFLQRVLYRINRLKFFWYDDLANYNNERSDYVRKVRDRIESAWQSWELFQLPSEAVDGKSVADLLKQKAARDVAPAISAEGLYYRNQMGAAGYCKLLEIASLDGLVEASQLSRTLGGVSNEIHAMMMRLLVEEYGGGRLARKHSSFFTAMLHEFGMKTEPEAYFDAVPWEVLATINHSFLLSERKRFYLRYVGGLLFTEISVPASFENYRRAAERLGMSEKARAYWELHIREDERHGRWMLEDVSLPLAELYPREAREIVCGYDQQKFMSDRARKAMALAVARADYEEAQKEAPAFSSPMLANLTFAAGAR